jgi:hypothetical protein
MSKLRLGALTLAVALSAPSCGVPLPVSHGCDGPANDHLMLVDRLRCSGLRVDVAPTPGSPVLRGHAILLTLSGPGLRSDATVTSYWYDDTDLHADANVIAKADAKRFAADGTVADRTTTVTYDGTPHLYQRERVIAIYAGDDPAITSLLTRLLGVQFAGR